MLTQEKLPDAKFKNLTTDWNDGTLIASLVDSMAPGLCPEAATMDPQNALENASHAMKLAEDWLGVPQVGVSVCTSEGVKGCGGVRWLGDVQ